MTTGYRTAIEARGACAETVVAAGKVTRRCHNPARLDGYCTRHWTPWKAKRTVR